MSRPIFEGVEFGDSLDLVAVQFVARKNTELVAGSEERDRDHQGPSECESVSLSECKILCHVRNLRPEQADPARWLLRRAGAGRDHREGAAEAAARLRSGPPGGLIVEDPALVQDAIHQERVWLASVECNAEQIVTPSSQREHQFCLCP